MQFKCLSGAVMLSVVGLGLNIPAPAASTTQAADRAAKEAKEIEVAPQAPFAAARGVIERIMRVKQLPSIAVAVTKDGKIVWEEGFGWADVERKIPATAHTPYSLASVTKPITATAIMTLNQAGKLNLDAHRTYLGTLRLKGYAGATEGVTARRIMALACRSMEVST